MRHELLSLHVDDKVFQLFVSLVPFPHFSLSLNVFRFTSIADTEGKKERAGYMRSQECRGR